MSKIDWEKRIIIGKSGTVYKILPEKISVGRWPKYELWSTLISTRMDMDTFIKTLNSVINRVNKAQTFGDMIQPYTELTDLRNGIVKYNETGRPQLVEFAALFCLKCDKEGNVIEDVGEITEDVIREKYNDWKEIDMNDFFACVKAHTIISAKLQARSGKAKKSRERVKEKELTNTYEKMSIFVVRNSGYSVEYVKQMPIFEMLDLFDVCVEISKKTKE